MSIQADITFERELWETAVTLRGTVAPGDYKHYVLPLLFLRDLLGADMYWATLCPGKYDLCHSRCPDKGV